MTFDTPTAIHNLNQTRRIKTGLAVHTGSRLCPLVGPTISEERTRGEKHALRIAEGPDILHLPT